MHIKSKSAGNPHAAIEVSGVIAEDPTKNPTAPFELHFRSMTVQMDGPTQGVAPFSIFQGAMVSLSFRDESHHHTLGSGVMVGPGLAICAHHVLADYWADIAAHRMMVVCEAITPETLLLWHVRSITWVENTDLAVLSMKLNCAIPNDPLSTAHITTRMPALGEELLIGGFTAYEASKPHGSDMVIGGETRYSKGKVIEIYADRRDKMLPGPTVAVECPALGGMSGGPVFDSRGYLMGVLSSSMEGEEVAYVSHVWPALRAQVNPVWPARMMPSRATLLSLGSRLSVMIERPEAFAIDVENGRMVLRYQQWT